MVMGYRYNLPLLASIVAKITQIKLTRGMITKNGIPISRKAKNAEMIKYKAMES